MKLKNILIVTDDIERSKKFYRDLFGLQVLTDFGANVIMTEGLVLQEKNVWQSMIGKASVCGDANAELYFEENEMDEFLQKLQDYPEKIRFLNPLTERGWGQRVVRIYDPDGHVIEVGETADFVVRRLYQSGMPVDEISRKTGFSPRQVRAICGMDECL